ncbi:MAG: class I SAM-dependent methyltransferase [Bryobacteraceae bacterium]|nr:class I SAM-dependent methyltransferase [Bryobacteraceae bacterium]
MHSARKLLLACAATALATAVAGVMFVETTYPAVRARLQTVLLGEVTDIPGDFRNPEVRKIAEERYDELIARANTSFDPKTMHDFVAGYAQLNIWRNMFYLGTPIQKYPNDLAVYQQVILEVKPDYIVETGTAFGGSALFYAHTLDGLGLKNSRVISVDLFDNTAEVSRRPLWQRYVEFIHASSTDPHAVRRIREKVGGKKVMMTLDSDHRAQHVYQELEMFSPLVSPGSYLVVEDTLIDGIPLEPAAGPGPQAALNRFLASNSGKLFEQDLRRDALILTQNRGGWLRRKTSVGLRETGVASRLGGQRPSSHTVGGSR